MTASETRRLSAAVRVVRAVTQRERPTRDQRDICESLVRLELKRLERESLRYWAETSQ